MRRRVLLLLVIACSLAMPGVVAQPDPVDLAIDHQLLDHRGEPVDGLTPGSGGVLNVSTTNGHDRSINVTYQLVQPEADGNGTVISGAMTGPIAPNGTRAAALPVTVDADASPGPRNLSLRGVVEVEEDGNWTRAGNVTRNVTLRVVAPTPPPSPFPVVPVALLVVAIGLGGAGAYLHLRQPDRRMPPERSEEEIQRGIEQRRESIEEAKRRDLEESIDRARERYEAGELTEYQFESIKERKEAQLEELEADDDGG